VLLCYYDVLLLCVMFSCVCYVVLMLCYVMLSTDSRPDKDKDKDKHDNIDVGLNDEDNDSQDYQISQNWSTPSLMEQTNGKSVH
jgi:hypothetical protein